MENTVILYYSATGNTKYAATFFSDAAVIDIIDILDKKAELPERIERLGIFFPVYCFSLPYPVRTFIRKCLSSRDNSALKYVFAVATCGGIWKSGLRTLEAELGDVGIALTYCDAVVMPDAYIPLSEAPEPEKVREIREKADVKLREIREEVSREDMKLPPATLAGRLFRKFGEKATAPGKGPKDLVLSAPECMGCGFCASACPMGNIRIEEGKAVRGEGCISCFACFHTCPAEAWKFRGRKVRYKGIEE